MSNLPVNESREYEMYLEKLKKLSDEHKSFMAGNGISLNFVFDCEELKENFQTFGNSHSLIKKQIDLNISKLSKFISDVEIQ